MNKRIICAVLSGAMIMSTSAPAFAAGLDREKLNKEVKNILSGYSDEEIVLTVEQAVQKYMTDSTAAQTVELNKLSDEAIANGYSQSYKTINEMLDQLDMLEAMGVPTIGMSSELPGDLEVKMLKKTRDFAKANIETNYQADKNSVEAGAYQLYYQTLQAQEYCKITEDDLKNKQDMYNNVQKKYRLGSASKLELMSAESELGSAQSALTKAQAASSSAKMAFNMQMGYPLMANTVLTGGITAVDFPEISLEDAIKSALEKRNEIGAIKFGFEVQEMNYNHAKVAMNNKSADFQKAKVAYLQMKQQNDQIETQIELDIRAKYANLLALKQTIDSTQNTVDLVQESYRISTISYDLGMSTLADLNKTAVGLNQARLGLVAAITEYNLAVKNFEYACGVGTFRVSF